MEHARKMQLSAIALNAAVTAKWGVPALKAAMDHLGLFGGPVRRPLLPAGDEAMRALVELLNDKTVNLYKSNEQ
jgi:dihydrodipicolinate synthase/N-acetylneuraminate lyase